MLNHRTLVFILGTQIPSLLDVSNSSGRQIEDRGFVVVPVPHGSRPSRLQPVGNLKPLGYFFAGGAIVLSLLNLIRADRDRNTRHATQRSSPSQPNNPPQAFVGREEHDDLGSVSRTQTYFWTILLTVSSLPLVPHRPEPLVVRIGEGKSKESGPAISTHAHHRRISSPLDLLSRADLEEGLVLFSRMLDELDY